MVQGGLVFWAILLLGAAALAVFFERLLTLRRAQIDYGDFLKGVCNVLEKTNDEEAAMLCEETPSPSAAVVLTAIRHRGSPREALRETVYNTERAELSRMERRLALLPLACQIAPLLGLLGTFLGAVPVVRALGAQTPVVLKADLAPGLLRALAATIAGLAVAVQCHVLYAILITRIERLTLDMEACASEIVAYLTRGKPGEEGGAAK